MTAADLPLKIGVPTFDEIVDLCEKASLEHNRKFVVVYLNLEAQFGIMSPFEAYKQGYRPLHESFPIPRNAHPTNSLDCPTALRLVDGGDEPDRLIHIPNFFLAAAIALMIVWVLCVTGVIPGASLQ